MLLLLLLIFFLILLTTILLTKTDHLIWYAFAFSQSESLPLTFQYFQSDSPSKKYFLFYTFQYKNPMSSQLLIKPLNYNRNFITLFILFPKISPFEPK